jgi:sulfhydrogenase subunit beta (sulfur reductase)
MESNFLPHAGLQTLLDILRDAGYRCIGPQVHDGAIVYRDLARVDQLPLGARDRQAPGSYRIEQTRGPRYFAWATGPQALKPWLFAPRETLWRAKHSADRGLQFSDSEVTAAQPLAVIGVRACDLAAMRLQDRHFLEGPVRDPHYAARRAGLFLVSVDCSHPADTCFCASTGDGPRAEADFDLALAELDEGFLLRVGSERGSEIAASMEFSPASDAQEKTAEDEWQASLRQQKRQLPSRDLREALFSNLTHPRWDAVGERCLSCGNCTSVCPTCFCHSELDNPSLDGSHSEHVREWDSCFTAGHSHIHGITLREDTGKRYRQWLTHKLGSWHDQYGRSGCVGCGRCIAWCPVGIDLTEEATVICAGETS